MVHLLYPDFFRFLEELSVGLSDPWLVYEDLYLAPHRAVLEAWWEQVLGLPRETWVDRVRQVRPQDYGLLQAVVAEGDLQALAEEALARSRAVLSYQPEPDIHFLVGFFSPDAFVFRVQSAWAIGIGLERFRSQRLMPVLIAHEYLHVFRKRLPEPRTLRERMVEEGFAVAFSARAFPDRPAEEHLLMRPGQVAVMQQYEARLWGTVSAAGGMDSTDRKVSERVIYGQAGPRDLPSRAGVYLGWRMVEEYLAASPGEWGAVSLQG
jgi:hypothetical protein